MKKVEEVHKMVTAEFGKDIPLQISDYAPSAYFDWEKITIPRKFLKWNKKMLTNVMRHEFGHLFFSPRDPDTGVIIAYIASVLGYKNPWIFANIITDMIVDMTNIEMFGSEYLEFLEWSIENAKAKLQIVGVMAGVYKEKARELGLKTKLIGHPVGRAIYRVLNNESVDFFHRVVEVAKIMLPYKAEIMPKHFIIYVYTKNMSSSDIARALIRKGLKPEDIMRGFPTAGDFGSFRITNDPVVIEYRRMLAIAKYMELQNDIGFREKIENISGQWSIGDPPQQLDVVRTISTYGIVLPGIYSMRSRESRAGKDSGGKRYRDCIIVLDVSGSMYGDKFERARESSYIVARRTYEDGGMVGLIPFSGEVWGDFTVPPTKDYFRVVDILFRIIPDGGTNMDSALERAYWMGKRYYLYIFSDANVYDVPRTLQLLHMFKGRVTFFLIYDSPNIDKWFEIDGVKVVEISSDGLVRRAFKEVK